ncbi:MAG: molybdenum cofactor guanylyltransferase MobA [Rhizobiaceae bacterium]
MTDSIAGLVLAGGGSRRMGGRDKFLLQLGARSLIDRAISRLEPQVGTLAISANCDPAVLTAWPYPVLPDPPPAGRGPLAGVLAGLDWCADQASHLVTVASDTPFYPVDLADRLIAAAGGDTETIVIAASCGRTHPVFGLWPVSIRSDLHDWLASGASLKVTDFIDSRPHRICAFPSGPNGDPFFNINTPDDMVEAVRRASETAP